MRRIPRIYILITVAVVLAWVGARLPAPPQIVEAHSRQRLMVTASPDELSAPSASLPARIERPMLTPAARNPFTQMPPRAPLIPKQPQPVITAIPSPPPPPPMNLSFIGRMTTPDGKELIYLAYGDTSMPIAVGQTLPNGYKVEAITESAVELSYPTLNANARLELPQPPKYEIR